MDFWLVAVFQGTAKTPKYTVLVDKGGDGAQMLADELQGLTYALAYNHQIVNIPISMPVAVYMADLWATRGKNNFNAFAYVD